jgi:hypothetical protein
MVRVMVLLCLCLCLCMCVSVSRCLSMLLSVLARLCQCPFPLPLPLVDELIHVQIMRGRCKHKSLSFSSVLQCNTDVRVRQVDYLVKCSLQVAARVQVGRRGLRIAEQHEARRLWSQLDAQVPDLPTSHALHRHVYAATVLW